MAATLTDCTTEAAADGSEPVDDLGAAPHRQGSAATEADKVRRQQHLRRKARLARAAMTANRSR